MKGKEKNKEKGCVGQETLWRPPEPNIIPNKTLDTMWAPPSDVRWFINHIKDIYGHHKPKL